MTEDILVTEVQTGQKLNHVCSKAKVILFYSLFNVGKPFCVSLALNLQTTQRF